MSADSSQDARLDSALAGRASDRRCRVLLLGGCHAASLRAELQNDFDCKQHWRKPTIALMSDPICLNGALGFDNRHSRYVVDDFSKRHLAQLLEHECDVFVFDLMRDVRALLLRCGSSYIFDPNQMYVLVPDAPKPSETVIDVAALLGSADIEPFMVQQPEFFDIWARYFESFYEALIVPLLAVGTIVIAQHTFLAKHTEPPSDLLREHWPYCDSVNPLLQRMKEHVAKYPHVYQISVPEHQCVTNVDAPFAGNCHLHPARKVFTSLAGQVRSIVDRKTAAMAAIEERPGWQPNSAISA